MNANPRWSHSSPFSPGKVTEAIAGPLEGASLSRVLPENDIPTWLSPCGATSTIDHFLLPQGTAGSARVLRDSGFPSDHFPVTLSVPSAVAFREDESLLRRTRFHLNCKDSAAAYERYVCGSPRHKPGPVSGHLRQR